MTHNNFEPFTAYNVDEGDAFAVGQLRHAANLGDQRARHALRGIDAKREKQRREDDVQRTAKLKAEGHSVQRGRDLYASHHPAPDAE